MPELSGPAGGDDSVATPAPDSAAPRRRGRPKLAPGEKGKYTRRKPTRAQLEARAERGAHVAAFTGGTGDRDAVEDLRDLEAGAAHADLDDVEPAGAPAPRRGKGGKAKRGGAGAGEQRPRKPLQVPKWLKDAGWQTDQPMTASQLRELKRYTVQRAVVPFLAAVIEDPDEDTNAKLRAADQLIKASVGYITPDMMLSEDVSELPPPIFNETTGELPPADLPPREDDEQPADTIGADGEPLARHVTTPGLVELEDVHPDDLRDVEGEYGGGPLPAMGVA